MNRSNELWQEYDEQQEPIGQGLTKDAAATGTLHGASHIWFWRVSSGKTEILLQKRAHNKRTWPSYLDISAAGHIDYGESPIEAALRETKEEIGLRLQSADLKLLFVFRQNLVASDTIAENEWQWVYGRRLDDIGEFTHDDEVASMHWVSLREFKKIIDGKRRYEKIVPHDKQYFDLLLKSISKSSA